MTLGSRCTQLNCPQWLRKQSPASSLSSLQHCLHCLHPFCRVTSPTLPCTNISGTFPNESVGQSLIFSDSQRVDVNGPSLPTWMLPSCLLPFWFYQVSTLTPNWSALTQPVTQPELLRDICNPHFNFLTLSLPSILMLLLLPHKHYPEQLIQLKDRHLFTNFSISCQTFVLPGSSTTSSPFDCMKSCSDRAASLGFTPTRSANCFYLYWNPIFTFTIFQTVRQLWCQSGLS